MVRIRATPGDGCFMFMNGCFMWSSMNWFHAASWSLPSGMSPCDQFLSDSTVDCFGAQVPLAMQLTASPRFFELQRSDVHVDAMGASRRDRDRPLAFIEKQAYVVALLEEDLCLAHGGIVAEGSNDPWGR